MPLIPSFLGQKEKKRANAESFIIKAVQEPRLQDLPAKVFQELGKVSGVTVRAEKDVCSRLVPQTSQH